MAAKGKGMGKGRFRGRETHFSRDRKPAKKILGKDGKEIRGIVRLAGKDVRGHRKVRSAISLVRGIGMNLGSAIYRVAREKLGIENDTMIGEISESKMKELEDILRHPKKYGIPDWMHNRQKEFVSGKTRHLIGPDLQYAVRQDIDHEKSSYTWKGYRHSYGQKVRGQRTRTTGRRGMTVGVMRKAVLAKSAAAGKESKSQGKK